MDKAALILNTDGSVYHLGLLPHEISTILLTVGDPDRVSMISRHFDHIEVRKQKREICTHTGSYMGKRLTVISTGMGTDNIDIVLNELDALVNLDLNTGQPKENFTPLTFIRLGTSGAIQPDTSIGSLLLSKKAIGVDNLLHFYSPPKEKETSFNRAIQVYFNARFPGLTPYSASANSDLINHFSTSDYTSGITVTHPGFYGPQGRQGRLPIAFPNWVQDLKKFDYNGLRMTNFDMETAGIFALAELMGHRALSINAILANRWLGTFSLQPKKDTERMIAAALASIKTL